MRPLNFKRTRRHKRSRAVEDAHKSWLVWYRYMTYVVPGLRTPPTIPLESLHLEIVFVPFTQRMPWIANVKRVDTPVLSGDDRKTLLL